MENNAVNLNRNVLHQSVKVLDQKLKQIIVASSTIMLNESYKETMRDIQAGNTSQYYVNFSLLQTSFSQTELIEQSIDSILISTPSGDFYPSRLRRSGIPIQETLLYQRIKDDPESGWVETHHDKLFAGDKPVISFIMQPMMEFYIPDLFLVVNVKGDLLKESLKGGAPLDAGRLLLMDTSGRSVFEERQRPDWTSSDAFMDLMLSEERGSFEYETGDDRVLVSFERSTFAKDWILISYLSKTELLQPVQNIQWLVLMVMFICIGIALLLARYLSGLLLAPLLKLQKAMVRVEQEDLSARFESPFQDEIGYAGRRFNQMVERIEDLIGEVKDNEEEKRRAEIKALQAQIDPHFLYNTLNTIFWKCEMDEYEDVKEMVISLSSLFRLGLNGGQEMTTLGKELEHVTQYLRLQQQCYEGLFQYSVTVPPELLDMPILKILLQPLVENSILHGFRDIRKQGLIHIEVSEQDGFLIILVKDNGTGIDEDKLEDNINRSPESGGYALRNIMSRLELYYGSEAILSLHRTVNEETEARILIPVERRIPS
ncbi:sensor histidine kinase [Paenibacillus lemnae]|uniref:Sensor histidine kinase n=2 Tax=Paenibacillus lemnae TaxID=1330551 RepID=A0A848M8W7_PAELE|nr:sensor histidine kinase [Paenibacillus lemnae]